jgi:hypothetical protein
VHLIADSARRHGIADVDMLHAVRNAIATEDLDHGFTMFIGPARNTSLVEVGVVDGAEARSSSMPWWPGVGISRGRVIANASFD